KEELNAVENLRISNGLSGKKLTREAAQASLSSMGLGDRGHLATRFLSEGQKRRSTLARLLDSGTSMWILDEALASLDTEAVNFIQTILDGHLKTGGIAVVATHQALDVSSGTVQRLN